MELTELKIDPEFKGLIKALQPREYLQLENNILTDGCREAIITWNGIIVDGHNRYEICKRHNIPFRIKEMDFDCREAVIAWICANQLGRRNISDETRKYLIGVQYHTEKIVESINTPAKILSIPSFLPPSMKDSLPIVPPNALRMKIIFPMRPSKSTRSIPKRWTRSGSMNPSLSKRSFPVHIKYPMKTS